MVKVCIHKRRLTVKHNNDVNLIQHSKIYTYYRNLFYNFWIKNPRKIKLRNTVFNEWLAQNCVLGQTNDRIVLTTYEDIPVMVIDCRVKKVENN